MVHRLPIYARTCENVNDFRSVPLAKEGKSEGKLSNTKTMQAESRCVLSFSGRDSTSTETAILTQHYVVTTARETRFFSAHQDIY